MGDVCEREIYVYVEGEYQGCICVGCVGVFMEDTEDVGGMGEEA